MTDKEKIQKFKDWLLASANTEYKAVDIAMKEGDNIEMHDANARAYAYLKAYDKLKELEL